jgi:hypothetical protein
MPPERGRTADIFQSSAQCNRRTIQSILAELGVYGSWSDDSEEKTVQPVSLPVKTGQPRLKNSSLRLPHLCLSFRHDKGQQGNCPGPLDGYGQFPLMFCTVSRNPARHDFASLRCEIPECLRFLVFNLQVRVRTETAEFPPVKELFLWSGPSAGAPGCRCRRHDQ